MRFFVQNPEKRKEKEKFFQDTVKMDHLIVSRQAIFYKLATAMDWKNERICSMALGKVFGFEPRVALSLVENLGSASAVFDLSLSQRDELLGPYSKHKGELTDRLLDEVAEEYERLSRMNAYYIAYREPDYPLALKEAQDPPVGLYVRCTTPPDGLFGGTAPVIAVVGTRDATPYGLRQCERLVYALAQLEPKPVIVSGLAFGVDICAHRTAMRYGLPTWGVMATGVDTIYPWRHRDDAIRMESAPGCALLSDYPLGTNAMAIHFIRRNRIIAALAKATLLVESKEKGGGLITARLAFDYGREVYAVPGRMEDVRSQGCNRLIAEKVAEAVCSPEQWLDSMGLAVRRPGQGRGRLGEKGCSEAEEANHVISGSGSITRSDTELCARMLELIRSECGISLGQLALELHCSEVKMAALASVLEADGLIRVDLLRRCRIND